jgi:hypothetical protein
MRLSWHFGDWPLRVKMAALLVVASLLPLGVATFIDVRQARERVLGLLATFPNSDSGIRGAALIDADGRVVVATEDAVVGVDLSDRPNVQLALQGRTVVTGPFVSPPRSGAVPTIAHFAPVPAPIAFSSGECEFLRQLSAHVALATERPPGEEAR